MDRDLLLWTILKFNVNTDLKDVEFRSCSKQPYESLTENIFGEKQCSLFIINFAVLNIEVKFKILSFIYDDHAEVLKLEIDFDNHLIKQELASCINFLQRRRNLNGTFDAIIKLAEVYEARRIICRVLFQRLQQATIVTSDKGINMKLFSKNLDILYLEMNWTIFWNKETCKMEDKIEFYCNNTILRTRKGKSVKEKLNKLVSTTSSFQCKLGLWKGLLTDLYGNDFTEVNLHKANSVIDLTNTTDLDLYACENYNTEIIDVDDGGNEIMVIE